MSVGGPSLVGRETEMLDVAASLDAARHARGSFMLLLASPVSARPGWPRKRRLQTGDVQSIVDVRRGVHPSPSTARRWRSQPTDEGFVFEFEERWEAAGEHWYARELLLAQVRDGRISEVAVYFTGTGTRRARISTAVRWH